MKIYFYDRTSGRTHPRTSEETHPILFFRFYFFSYYYFSSYIQKDPPGGEEEHRPRDHDNGEEKGAWGLVRP